MGVRPVRTWRRAFLFRGVLGISWFAVFDVIRTLPIGRGLKVMAHFRLVHSSKPRPSVRHATHFHHVSYNVLDTKQHTTPNKFVRFNSKCAFARHYLRRFNQALQARIGIILPRDYHLKIIITHRLVFSATVFNSRCLVAAFNGWRSPSTALPN
jgi:hypothetical protein